MLIASHLYPAVPPVSHNDVSIGIHSHAGGSIELAISFSVRAKFEEEVSICTVHLGQEVSKKTSLGRLCRNESSQDHNGVLLKTISFERSMCYLHGVIVKIGHDYFILVVDCNKVWTWIKREAGYY